MWLRSEADRNPIFRSNLWPHISFSVSLSLHKTKCDFAHNHAFTELFTSVSWGYLRWYVLVTMSYCRLYLLSDLLESLSSTIPCCWRDDIAHRVVLAQFHLWSFNWHPMIFNINGSSRYHSSLWPYQRAVHSKTIPWSPNFTNRGEMDVSRRCFLGRKENHSLIGGRNCSLFDRFPQFCNALLLIRQLQTNGNGYALSMAATLRQHFLAAHAWQAIWTSLMVRSLTKWSRWFYWFGWRRPTSRPPHDS
jgi:hypothetical protein